MPDADVKPTLLDVGIVMRALEDPNFYTAVPEFLLIRKRVTELQESLKVRRGCSGCKRRRVHRTLFSDFTGVLNNMAPDGIERLKKYLGAQALMLQWRDPSTKQHKVKVI
jgi:hypothetical protein